MDKVPYTVRNRLVLSSFLSAACLDPITSNMDLITQALSSPPSLPSFPPPSSPTASA